MRQFGYPYRKYLSIMLVMIMVVSNIFISTPMIVEAASEAPAGSGTQYDPYEISSVEDLKWLAENPSVWDKYFIQTTDINLDVAPYNSGEGWVPIGNENDRFTGVYDGRGHKIYNLMITQPIFEKIEDSPQSFYLGLFGYVDGGVIVNVGLENIDIEGAGRIGALAGIITNKSIVSNTYATTGQIAGRFRVGGLIGSAWDGSVISGSYADVTIMGHGTETFVGTEPNRNVYHGGLVGYLKGPETVVKYCYATGDVRNGIEQTGGLIGGVWPNDNKPCYVENCYATGDVQGNVQNSTRTGGLIGIISGSEVKYSYSTGKVTGKYYTGGLVGGNYSNSWGNDNFWDMESSKISYSPKGIGSIGKTTSEMKDASTFNNWDFDYGWEEDSVNNGNYPYFKKPLTISGTFRTNDKIYDGTTNATIDENNLILVSTESGHPSDVNLNPVAVFEDHTVHTNKEVNLKNSTLDDTDTYFLLLDYTPFATASILKNEYSIIYNGNGNTGGTVPDADNYLVGDTVTVQGNTGNLAKTGYTFAGWNTSSGGGGTSYTGGDTFSMGSSDLTLYAQWTASGNVVYKVEHYQQDVTGEGYILAETENLTGTTGAEVSAVAKNYPDFTENTAYAGRVASGNITADGSLVLKLYYDRNTYTVTFKDWDGTELKTEQVRYAGAATAPDPSREGYRFTGWDIDFSNITSDLTVTAEYSINQYTVSFNSNGGSSVASVTADYDTLLSEPTTPTKADYDFSGWYKESELDTEWIFATDTIPAGNITLYAKWVPSQGSITMVASPNSVEASDSFNQIFTLNINNDTVTGSVYGSDISLSGVFSSLSIGETSNNDNTVTTSVYGNLDSAGTGVIKLSQNKLLNRTSPLSANIIVTPKPTYLVSYNSNGAISGSVPADNKSYEKGDTVTIKGNVGNLAKNGYTFAGWNTKTDGGGVSYQAGDTLIMGNSDVTLYAQWTASENAAYKVEHYQQDVTGEGYTLAETENLTGTINTEVGAAAKNYQGFSENISHDSRIASGTIAADESLVLKLHYDRNTYKVTFKDWDGTEQKTEQVRYSGAATAPGDPSREGYRFTGWDVNFSNVISDLIVTAEYSINQYTVTFNSNGGSSVASKTVAYNTKVEEPSRPSRGGYIFKGWYEDEKLIKAFDFNTPIIEDITLYAKWSRKESSSSGSSGGESRGNEEQEDTIVIVNGEKEKAGEEHVQEEAGEKIVEVKIKAEAINNKIEEIINKQSQETNEEKVENIVEIPVTTQDAKQVSTKLTGDIVKKMDENGFKLSIKTNDISYAIPAKEVGIESIAQNLGIQADKLREIEVEVKIDKVDNALAKKIEESAKAKDCEVVFPPVNFEIVAKTKINTREEKEVKVSKFKRYVQREMKIPAGVDPSKITTGIVYNPDGTFSHIPTTVFEKEGRWYAKLNSLTNSTYSVIWNPIEVNTVENHWSKVAVNDMASRVIIKNPEEFNSDGNITRGEFAEYITKALGIYRTGVAKEEKFTDIRVTNDLADAIVIATEYGIINGYPDGSFNPDNQISREEAMVMYARAMDIVGLKEIDNGRIGDYKDTQEVSDWAYDCVRKTIGAEVFNGRTIDTIDPKGTFTYAEAATAIRNLLIASGLINK